MKDVLELRRFYSRANEDVVLCTIVRKTGSSYRGLFAKKLVSSDDTCGLLSGGCLEREIEEIARQDFSEPFVRTFNSLSEEDRLFGYQKGCAGAIEVLFEKLPREKSQMDLYFPFGSERRAAGVEISLNDKKLGARSFAQKPTADRLFEPWIAPIELTIIGCGAAADPFLELAETLGWTVNFVDYRSEFAHPERFPGKAVQPTLLAIDKIADSIKTGTRSALVLTTHNFEADLQIFSGLVNKNFAYIGCVGPKHRFELLKKDLKKFFDKEPTPDWEERVVKASPGITPVNSNPVEIAFSIVAEIQLKLGESAHA